MRKKRMQDNFVGFAAAPLRYTVQDSLKMLETIFLTCPECDCAAPITSINKKFFTVTCPCTSWRIYFSIKEAA